MSARLSDADARELAALQARAYGPDADLDPVGQERLRDLEHRGIETPAVETPAVEADQPPQPLSKPEEVAVTRRHPLLLVAGALAAGAVLVGAGYALGSRPPAAEGADTFLAATAPDAGRVTTLVSAAPFTSRGLDPATLVQYESLGDATFWTATEADGTQCLLITVPIDGIELAAYGGVYQASCAPGGLAPSIDWTVTSGYPSPPDLPVGSIVRLTLDGDRLRVETGRAP